MPRCASRVEALPNVPTPKIDKLELERLTVEADERAVDEQIKQLASQSKRWSDAPKKHAAALGDLVVMDFEGKVGGKPFEGGKGEDMSVELGSGRLIPGFEEQLVGAKAGDKREVKLAFPADYPAKNLANKDATFAVTVKAVKTAGENKVDDEFAKSLGLQDLDQLKGLIRDQQEQELNGLTRTHMKRQLLDQLAARHDFAVPESMVEAEYQNILGQLRHEASHEADPQAALAEIEKDSPRISPDRRASRAPRPAAVGNRRRQRRRGQRPGNEPPDRPGRVAISGRGPQALPPAGPAGADVRGPDPRAAV